VAALDLSQIQGLIARGYPDLTAASYVLLQIEQPEAARAWLASVVDQVTPGPARPADAALNVALTASGLQALGLPSAAMAMFSNEFTAGMITAHRRRILGDVDESAPEAWLWGGPVTPAIDLLLLLFARDAALLEARYASLSAGFSGVSVVHRLDSLFDLQGKEHFGFADGLSQPTIAGLSDRIDLPANTIQPGEFVLGYPNEYGRYTQRPLLNPSADPGHILSTDPSGSGQADFGQGGVYLVVRHLAQDVRGFWRYVDAATRHADGSPDPDRRLRLASKMVGRWPSGAPLTLTPDADDPLLATANDFTYQYADAFGFNCPIGSHVRRAHPRDSLDPDPGTERSVALDRHHRLLRRGREYGPPVGDPLAEAAPDDPERGLFFICLVGNIARQFEFVQHTWINSPKFDGLYEDPDPLIGVRGPGAASFRVPGDPVRERYHDLPRFVSVRGGGYFFLPGLRALRYLAQLTPAGGVQPGKVSLPVGS
jgi:Dyp-type peroxidase family